MGIRFRNVIYSEPKLGACCNNLNVSHSDICFGWWSLLKRKKSNWQWRNAGGFNGMHIVKRVCVWVFECLLQNGDGHCRQQLTEQTSIVFEHVWHSLVMHFLGACAWRNLEYWVYDLYLKRIFRHRLKCHSLFFWWSLVAAFLFINEVHCCMNPQQLISVFIETGCHF